MIYQSTPDAGTGAAGEIDSRLWYDKLGRVVASQNAEQALTVTISGSNYERYSFTSYDDLGRIEKVGLVYVSVGDVPDAAVDDPSWPTVTAMNWNPNHTDQVTTTIYETPVTVTGVAQRNLRNRVSSMTYTHNDGVHLDEYATYYSYDIHGNVDDLWQHDKKISTFKGNAELKHMSYDYDLISGNVHRVSYQAGSTDEWYHRYEYDADNRILHAYTSGDGYLWDRDAEYSYYRHGLLARSLMGDDQVQGMDYAYTIQGWIKGVNSNALTPLHDMGKDGLTATQVSRDAFGYSLDYFAGDYASVVPSTFLASNVTNNIFDFASPSLYNGNIRAMTTTVLTDPTAGTPIPEILGTAYKYDQLNRIVWSESYGAADFDMLSNSWVNVQTSPVGMFRTEYEYDAMGNITSLKRADQNGVGGGGNSWMDNIDYGYNYHTGTGKLLNNKLDYVYENVTTATAPGNDIEHSTAQIAGNFSYDRIGNLTSDDDGDIVEITWNTYGKITYIEMAGSKADLEFFYGPGGNRVAKKVVGKGGDPDEWTYYVRDASGNVMATYDREVVGTDIYHLREEAMIYGSSRLGYLDQPVRVEPLASAATTYANLAGNKRYELSNHLGNVIAVVSDWKLGHVTGGVITEFRPDKLRHSFYYPFGMHLPDNSDYVDLSGDYRFSFQGQERDDEVYDDGNAISYKYRVHDPRLGRFLSVDPLAPEYPWNSSYAFSENRVINAIELEGLEAHDAISGVTMDKPFSDQQELTALGDNMTAWVDLVVWDVNRNSESFELAQQRIEGLYPMPIYQAEGIDMNFDYYSIHVEQLPPGYDHDRLYREFRAAFFDLVGGESVVKPYPGEEELWQSENPLGAVLTFRFLPVAEFGSVITSAAQEHYWILTPVSIFNNERFNVIHTHPLAGNRQFGITSNPDGSHTIYARGVDKIWSTAADHFFQSKIYSDQGKFWTTFQTNTMKWVNNLGGIAWRGNIKVGHN